MKVLAFLQNSWFKDPPRMQRQLETTFKGDREKFNATWLFFGCTTGKRLNAALGDYWCDRIIWQEASPLIAGFASGSFPADVEHMQECINRHKPDVVIAFGKIAENGLKECRFKKCQLVISCHPAARHASVCDDLAAVRKKLRTIRKGLRKDSVVN